MRLLIVGAGGHARVIAEIAMRQFPEADIAFLDDGVTGEVDDLPVLGRLDDLPRYASEPNLQVVIGIGENRLRKVLAERNRTLERVAFATVVDPSAVISQRAELGAGTVVMPKVVANTGTRVGRHVILNTACSVDHDCVIGDFAHISPGAHLAGAVTVGEGAQVGVGASVIPGVRIGAWSVVGAGSVVVRDIPDGVVAYGVPARPVRKL